METPRFLTKEARFTLHPRMTDYNPTSRKSRERAARQERLADALRENLRRRKEQARGQEQLRSPQQEERHGVRREPTA